MVRLDRRLVLGQGETHTDVGVHVALGNVVHHLPNVPTPGAIGSLELLFGEPIDSLAEASRRCLDLLDKGLSLRSGERRRRGEFPYRIGKIRHSTSLFKAPIEVIGSDLTLIPRVRARRRETRISRPDQRAPPPLSGMRLDESR